MSDSGDDMTHDDGVIMPLPQRPMLSRLQHASVTPYLLSCSSTCQQGGMSTLTSKHVGLPHWSPVSNPCKSYYFICANVDTDCIAVCAKCMQNHLIRRIRVNSKRCMHAGAKRFEETLLTEKQRLQFLLIKQRYYSIFYTLANEVNEVEKVVDFKDRIIQISKDLVKAKEAHLSNCDKMIMTLETQVADLKIANLIEMTRLQAVMSNRTLIEGGTMKLFRKQEKKSASFSKRVEAVVQSVFLPEGKLTSSTMDLSLIHI